MAYVTKDAHGTRCYRCPFVLDGLRAWGGLNRALFVVPRCMAGLSETSRHQLDPSRRNRQAMLLAMSGLDDNEVKAIAISIYAIARTVQALRGSSGCEVAPLMKLYLEESRKRS